MTTLDHRSPLVLDTRELGRRPGTMRTVRRTVEAPADLGTVVIGVAEGSPVELDLRLELAAGGDADHLGPEVLRSGHRDLHAAHRTRTPAELVRVQHERRARVEVTGAVHGVASWSGRI